MAARAAILVTGDEVLRGRIADANGGFLARELDAAGVVVEGITVVGDGLDALAGALTGALSRRPDLVVTSGGLGPTHDDRTMEAVAAVTGRPLALDEGALRMVVAARAPLRGVERVGAAVRDAVERKQATLPRGAAVLPPVGTAPGCVVEHAGTVVCVLPGPPWELAAMWRAARRDDPVVAAVLARAGGAERLLLRLYGVVESEVVDLLQTVSPATRDAVEVGVCARAGEVEMSVRGASRDVGEVSAAVTARFGDRVYSRDGATALDIAAAGLRGRGETLAVAESCTGGMIGARLTAVPGASEWFLGGVVAYDNAVKTGLLGVPGEVIARHGAVSEECAAAMAAGARRATGADWGLSVTGVAGPGGGTPDKPVGLVHLGLAGPGGYARVLTPRVYRGDRERIRERAAALGIHLLRLGLADTTAV